MSTIVDTQLENWRRNLDAISQPHGATNEISEAAKISRTYLPDLKSGRKKPSLEVALKIQEATGFTIADMLQSPKVFRRLCE